MSSALFVSGFNAYQVSNIVYAGPVLQIPQDRQRNGSTFSFKIITRLGAFFSYFKDEDTAKKSRSALYMMLETIKPKAFKHGHEFLDPAKIISFGNVIEFKKSIEGYTHGIVVTVDTAQEKSQEVWLRFKSEDHAKKSRKALWATVHAVNGMTQAPQQSATPAQPQGGGLPF